MAIRITDDTMALETDSHVAWPPLGSASTPQPTAQAHGPSRLTDEVKMPAPMAQADQT
jgi:hypothetical protein